MMLMMIINDDVKLLVPLAVKGSMTLGSTTVGQFGLVQLLPIIIYLKQMLHFRQLVNQTLIVDF